MKSGLKEKFDKAVEWSKKNPLMAAMIAAAVLLVILQIIRVGNQYMDLLRTVEELKNSK